MSPLVQAASCARRFRRPCTALCCLAALATLLLYCGLLHQGPGFVPHQAPPASSSPWGIVHEALRRLKEAIATPRLFSYRNQKLVLLWTPFFSERGVWLPSARDLQCPVQDCRVTADRDLASQSDAVVLHWRDVNPEDLPPPCNSSSGGNCPLWVLLNKEAPPHTDRETLAKIQDRVHWTVTYRRDSDIPALYGRIVPAERSSLKVSSHEDQDSNGDPLVCWLVSNCATPSRRELFVQELQKHVNVTKYGRCGTFQCPFQGVADCYRMLAESGCRLYLSLENSDCRDYVTEKLFYALTYGMVPVVRARKAGYSVLLPPRSYIDADDFADPQELAEYLRNVSVSSEMYRSYQWWRRTWQVEDAAYQWYCGLCERLHNATEVELARSRAGSRDLVQWWFSESGCS